MQESKVLQCSLNSYGEHNDKLTVRNRLVNSQPGDAPDCVWLNIIGASLVNAASFGYTDLGFSIVVALAVSYIVELGSYYSYIKV